MITKHPALIYQQEISQICKPLLKLNITYFAHVRITNDHEFSGISNNPAFIEHYLKNKYYTSDIHRIDESKIGNFILWEAIEFTEIGEQICRESASLGVHNPFTIINKGNDWTDYYHFANNTTDKRINQSYLANIGLLNSFIEYFTEQVNLSRSLSSAYRFTFNMNAPITSPIMTNFGNDTLIYDKANFFQDIKLQKKPKPLQVADVDLSKRQNEILRLVIFGKTIKEISKILDLSPRTVEHYFETIKTKFNVYSKSELIAKPSNVHCGIVITKNHCG